MLKLEIPEQHQGLAPLVVTAPTTRCGTTLLQRVLSSAHNGFLYGEEVGGNLKIMAHWLLGVMRRLERDHATRDEEFNAALEGNLAAWRPGLGAPSDVTLKSALETFYQIPTSLADHARAINRPIWGFKYPGYDHDTLRALLVLMPGTRIIYLVRNPLDALRSAKARRFVVSLEEVRAFCETWTLRVSEIQAFRTDPRVLVLPYEDLVGEKAAQMARIEAFTGLLSLDERAFDLKVNTYRGDETRGYAPTEYIAPVPLTPEETAAALRATGAAAAEFYGDITKAA